MHKHETISTKKFAFLIVTLWIGESPYFGIFQIFQSSWRSLDFYRVIELEVEGL